MNVQNVQISLYIPNETDIGICLSGVYLLLCPF